MTTGETLAARLRDIAQASTPGVGVTRLPWTDPHRAALRHIRSWMEAAGLEVSLDAAGTLIGSSPNPEGKPVLLIGSHQDSVPSGGAYDGIMGVAVGCCAAEALKDDLPGFPFALEVMAFADEEGVRFPTALIGPRALAGTLSPEALDMRDRDGATMRDAMVAFGCDAQAALTLKRKPGDIVGYLETHIEQGPVLEIEGQPAAAVSAICGISRHAVTVTGETGHAGTVPMAGRRDALVAASRLFVWISEAAASRKDIRATIGTLDLSPGAVNAIPAEVVFSLEIRAADDAAREAFEAETLGAAVQICGEAGCAVSASRTYVQPAVACNPILIAAFESALAEVGISPLTIPSGATHDASAMADLCPVAMLFVRCRNGISHRPDEFAAAEDMEVAVNVVSHAITRLAKETSKTN